MIFGKIFGRAKTREGARPLYEAILAQSRREPFYSELGVPDTLDGRFEMLVLHAFLIMRRLRKENDARAAAFSQTLFDLMFDDVDVNLRQSGVNDIRVGGRVKTMAKLFFGRIAAYDKGLDGQADLADALDRNLFRDVASSDRRAVAAVATYLNVADALLTAQAVGAIMAGEVSFPDAPRLEIAGNGDADAS